MPSKKPFIYLIVFVLALALAPQGFAESHGSSRTALVIKNASSSQVEVGVILAALGGACPAGHPPVTADQLAAAGFCSNVVNSGHPPYAGKCSLTLDAGASTTFTDIPNTCISGNVTFGGYASCPSATFPTGTTTAEFTLNPQSGAEAIDISLVNGYNAAVTMTMSGGGGWTYGPNGTSINKIANKPLGMNVGNPGVYPKDCTDCIRLVGPPVCPGFPTHPTCQKERICNAQRGTSGGTVTITLLP